MAKQYQLLECRVCDRYRFMDEDKWYEKPTRSELFMKVIAEMSKKGICNDCMQKIRSESKLSE